MQIKIFFVGTEGRGGGTFIIYRRTAGMGYTFKAIPYANVYNFFHSKSISIDPFLTKKK